MRWVWLFLLCYKIKFKKQSTVSMQQMYSIEDTHPSPFSNSYLIYHHWYRCSSGLMLIPSSSAHTTLGSFCCGCFTHKEESAKPRAREHFRGGDSVFLIDSSFDLFLYFITSTRALFPCSFHLFPTWLNTNKLVNLCCAPLCSEQFQHLCRFFTDTVAHEFLSH